MNIKQIVNSKGLESAAAAENRAAQDLHLIQSISQANSFPISETDSERSNSPHDSEHSRYSAPRLLNGMNETSNSMRYSSSTAIQNQLPMIQQLYRSDVFDNGMMQQDNSGGSKQQASDDRNAQKKFLCPTCSKGFARRSDLARHERIHSGVRPHICDHPGCHKQFILRSALTAHQRIHTGEKPHMCEQCGKPFSDSSSLARHRRIHSGKRPHQCPYADCQKTFTRRTTLTRHQSHHIGTIEEAAAATAAALATRGSSNRSGHKRSDGDQYSNNGSSMSTPSPGERILSASPHSELAPNMHRHPWDYQYMNNSPLPDHLRGEYQMPNQPPPSSTTSFSNGMRPTSHPTGSRPPSILETPANMEQHQPRSANESSRIGTVGWQSPSQNILSPSQRNGFAYPEPDPYSAQVQSVGHMYYPDSNIRRPQSTGLDRYNIKPRINNEGMWTAAR